MNIRFFKPIKQLRQHIYMIWAFENPEGIPIDDARLIAPNGCVKLIVPYNKCVTSFIDNTLSCHQPMSCIIIGQTVDPAIIDSKPGGGTLGIEFHPSSAALFFKTDLQTLTNRIYNSDDIWGSSGYQMNERLSNIEGIERKVEFLQHYLLHQMQDDPSNKVLEYAVNKIIQTYGFISVSQLSEDICYSRQHLARLFSQKIGISPKEFACITRFQRFYSKINMSTDYKVVYDLYSDYYDLSHYSKEFQKYTGYTPSEYSKIRNDFGRIFYQNQDVPFLQYRSKEIIYNND